MTLYSLSGLVKSYGSRRVIDIPRLELPEGKIYALLGPNGAGKTTLLNLLAFLDAPSSGRLFFRGQAVNFSESDLQPLRRQVVMVDQNPILFSTTVANNIEFGLKIRGVGKPQRTRLIKESLELVGMSAFAAAEAQKLSGGETQRVALARALALSPRVFLCDEPTANVDIENQAVIVDLLGRINASKKITVLFTTHDRSQASALADKTLVLDNGRLIQSGYDNHFVATVSGRGGTAPSLDIGSNLKLPLPPAHPDPLPPSLKVVIDPVAIKVVRCMREEESSKAGNYQIIQLSRENGGVRMVVAAGVRLTVRLDAAKYQELRPMIGDMVQLEIPPGAVQIVS